MTEQRDTYQIALSREELLNVMAYMKIKRLPGFDLDWVQALTEEQSQLCSEVAERALIARGFLARDQEGQVHVNPLAFAAVGACAAPEISVLLRQVVPDEQLLTYNFHISRNMNVIHFKAQPMIHEFLAMDEKEKLFKAILSNLSLPTSTDEIEQNPVDISMDALNEARSAVKDSGLDGLRESLPSDLFSEQGYTSFTTILAEPDSYSVLVLVDLKKQKTEDFSILQGKDTLWMLDPSPNDSNQSAFVTVSPTTPNAVTDRISPYFSN